jgi:hypothetical protein
VFSRIRCLNSVISAIADVRSLVVDRASPAVEDCGQADRTRRSCAASPNVYRERSSTVVVTESGPDLCDFIDRYPNT